jgi:hypothetical protein
MSSSRRTTAAREMTMGNLSLDSLELRLSVRYFGDRIQQDICACWCWLKGARSYICDTPKRSSKSNVWRLSLVRELRQTTIDRWYEDVFA